MSITKDKVELIFKDLNPYVKNERDRLIVFVNACSLTNLIFLCGELRAEKQNVKILPVDTTRIKIVIFKNN